MEIAEGDFIAISGQSGCGKTTLLNMLSAVDIPDEGSVCFCGVDLARMNESERAEYRNRTIGYIFQDFYMVPYLTLSENVALPLVIAGVGIEERKRLLEEMLSRYGLSGKANRYPDDLSGGEKQRAGFARALINKPKLILADEPTNNLDEFNADNIVNGLKEISESGNTVVLVTHNNRDVRYCNKFFSLKEGELSVL